MNIRNKLLQLQNEVKDLKQSRNNGTAYRMGDDGYIIEISDGNEIRMTEAEFIAKKEQEVKEGISVRLLEGLIDENCPVIERYEYKETLKKGDLKLEDLIINCRT